MQISFVGSGIKKDSNDLIYEICENIRGKVCKINKDIKIEYKYRNLSEEFNIEIDIENPEEYEVLAATTIFDFENLKIGIELKKLIYEEEKTNIFVKIDFTNEVSGDVIELTEKQKEYIYIFKIEVSRSLSKYMKSINWLYDDQNAYMLQELYLKTYNLENGFRTLINEYMLKIFGEDWFEKQITKKFNEKSNSYVEWYNSKYKKLNYIDSKLFNLQTKDLISMLKESYENPYMSKVKEYINEIKTSLNEDVDKVINKEILESKTLWEKYFKSKFPSDIEEVWAEFSEMRNTIAHNKIISIEFYIDMILKTKELEDILISSKGLINESIKSQEEKIIREYIKDLDLDFILEDVGFERYEDEEDVVEKIINNDEFMRLYSLLEESANKLKSRYEDLWGEIDEIDLYYTDEEEIESFRERLQRGNNIFNNENKNIIEEAINKTDNIKILEEVADYLQNMVNDKKEKLEECLESIIFSEEFRDKENIFKWKVLNGDEIEIKIDGWFCMGRGETSQIYINYKLNNAFVERGMIDISLGDYEEHDDGYFMPVQEQCLNVSIAEIYNRFEEDVEKEFKCIEDIEKILLKSN